MDGWAGGARGEDEYGEDALAAAPARVRWFILSFWPVVPACFIGRLVVSCCRIVRCGLGERKPHCGKAEIYAFWLHSYIKPYWGSGRVSRVPDAKHAGSAPGPIDSASAPATYRCHEPTAGVPRWGAAWRSRCEEPGTAVDVGRKEDGRWCYKPRNMTRLGTAFRAACVRATGYRGLRRKQGQHDRCANSRGEACRRAPPESRPLRSTWRVLET
jgi:hypothetical protein